MECSFPFSYKGTRRVKSLFFTFRDRPDARDIDKPPPGLSWFIRSMTHPGAGTGFPAIPKNGPPCRWNSGRKCYFRGVAVGGFHPGGMGGKEGVGPGKDESPASGGGGGVAVGGFHPGGMGGEEGGGSSGGDEPSASGGGGVGGGVKGASSSAAGVGPPCSSGVCGKSRKENKSAPGSGSGALATRAGTEEEREGF